MCTQMRLQQVLRDVCVKAAALHNVFVVALLQREVRGAALHDRTVKNYGPEAGRKSNLAFIIGALKEKNRGNSFQTRINTR